MLTVQVVLVPMICRQGLESLLLLLNEVLTCTKERQVKRTFNTCPDECVYPLHELCINITPHMLSIPMKQQLGL